MKIKAKLIASDNDEIFDLLDKTMNLNFNKNTLKFNDVICTIVKKQEIDNRLIITSSFYSYTFEKAN